MNADDVQGADDGALRSGARAAWAMRAVDDKLAAVAALARRFDARLRARSDERRRAPLQAAALAGASLEAGRPERPHLVAPGALPARGAGRDTTRAALLHAIAHIEFNAVNLALDAVWRYPGMPSGFALDWLSVADDERRHFLLVRDRMRALGSDYGDFDAHDGLWRMAERTAGDLLARMALVPRVLEARGLDATPLIQARLRGAGDETSARVLQTILDDEIGHVRLGDRWFRRLAAERGLCPEAAYRDLIERFQAPRPRGPLNREARLAAGFSTDELAWLSQARAGRARD